MSLTSILFFLLIISVIGLVIGIVRKNGWINLISLMGIGIVVIIMLFLILVLIPAM